MNAPRTASWVIREIATGRVIMETFSANVAGSINQMHYEAVPILAYLQAFNRQARAALGTP